MNKFTFYFISIIGPICAALLGYCYGDLLHRPGVEIPDGFNGVAGATLLGLILLAGSGIMLMYVIRHNMKTDGQNMSNIKLGLLIVGSLSLVPLFTTALFLSESYALHQIHTWFILRQ